MFWEYQNRSYLFEMFTKYPKYWDIQLQDQHCLQAIRAAVAQKLMTAMVTRSQFLYPEIQTEILKKRQEIPHPSEYILRIFVY